MGIGKIAWIIVNRLCKRQKKWMYYGNFDRNFNVYLFSIVAVCDGDWSGIEAIIKFVAGFALFAFVLYLMTQPALILVCIIVAVVIGVAKSKK